MSKNEVLADEANDKAYHFHYISLDSTIYYAQKALSLSEDYESGVAEANNNIAFAEIIRMDFGVAEQRLCNIIGKSPNQIEQLVANVQMMRICQRQSRNKEFYDYYWRAKKNLARIAEDIDVISDRQYNRVLYAETEMQIILSAYLYYVGLINESRNAIAEIDNSTYIQQDTTLLLNYFYNIGSGSYFHEGTKYDIAQTEFDYLARCYFLASRGGYRFWQANALQALSEHMQADDIRDTLIFYNGSVVKSLNYNDLPKEDIAENLAIKSVELFSDYGDIYQTSGALRTLSDCYFGINDNIRAIDCLNEALTRDTLVNQTPALMSSIYEKLAINYSAIGEKPQSDYYRNIYLDLQEKTRQDKELEARVEQFDSDSIQMSIIITAVIIAIIVVIVLLIVFSKMGKNSEKRYSVEGMLKPLEEWKQREVEVAQSTQDCYDELKEHQYTAQLLLERNIHNNIEQRAKLALINSITPFIDRMLGEVRCLVERTESPETIDSRFEYIIELTDKINEYNNVLTKWIQLKKGELSLKIESFSLQSIFDIIRKNRMSYNMKGVNLVVEDTNAVIKADKTLTLFMVNTLADNARKATDEGGEVRIYATDKDEYVEIAVCDTGCGMDQAELADLFNHKPSQTSQHGYGLMNCKGIIEKYKKVSHIFSVCSISAESEKGKGTTLRIRLPHGVIRLLTIFICLACSIGMSADIYNERARAFSDSVYFNNLQGHYERSLSFADSACTYFNKRYSQLRPKGTSFIKVYDDDNENISELQWLADSLDIDYNAINDMRNEVAVAALALKQWDMYNYNNRIYIRLFRERSADPTLMSYVEKSKHKSETQNMAAILLFLLLLTILPAYYFLFYRHKLYYRYLLSKIKGINNILLSDMTEETKLSHIESLWNNENIMANKNSNAVVLDDVVKQICEALKTNARVKREAQDNMDVVDDDIRKLNYENDKLHIVNNVLDNCFSTIKHETMYYPSRINVLINQSRDNIGPINELCTYYKELYTTLSMQAQKQVDTVIRLDENISRLLVQLLKKMNGGKSVNILLQSLDTTYNQIIAEMPMLKLTPAQTEYLFTPMTTDLTALVVRQLIREVGESTNHRGCGVSAVQRADGGTDVRIIISKKYNFK